MTSGSGAERRPFGTLPDGRAVEAIVLTSGRTSATVISLGAALQALLIPDREGRPEDVVLGHGGVEGYLASRDFFGATVGRYANRIAGAAVTIDGRRHRLVANEGANMLHGGAEGFDRKLWNIAEVGRDEALVTLRLHSADGEEGFPGALAVTATYRLDEGILTVDYHATCDAPTIVNLSNHAYFNLAGEGGSHSALEHLLTIPGDHYLSVDEALIPTGELRAVAGTPFDFRTPTPVGRHIRDASDAQLRIGRGFDHNWVIGGAGAPRVVARLEDPGSGRIMEIVSDRPGLQFYSGNFLDGRVVGKSGRSYRQGDALALEPQLPPDTPAHPEWESARLDPGQTYHHRIEYRFTTG